MKKYLSFRIPLFYNERKWGKFFIGISLKEFYLSLIHIWTSFADITRELNRQEIVTCDEQKLSRADQVQFQRFETIKKKHWSPTTVAVSYTHRRYSQDYHIEEGWGNVIHTYMSKRKLTKEMEMCIRDRSRIEKRLQENFCRCTRMIHFIRQNSPQTGDMRRALIWTSIYGKLSLIHI